MQGPIATWIPNGACGFVNLRLITPFASTATIRESPQARFAGHRSLKSNFSTLSAAPPVDRATASCSYHGFTHQRAVEFSANEFCISDKIDGPAGEHDIEQFWHFAQEPRELAPGRWDIGDIAEFTADGGLVEPAWRSRCFGTKESAWVVVVRRRTGLPAQLHARLRLLT